MGTNWIVVSGANNNAADVRDQLVAAGLTAEIFACVPADQIATARQILESNQRDADPSADLDLETIAVFHGIDGEMQAAAVQSLLQDAGISVVVESAYALPSLPFEVKVAKRLAAAAREIVAQAEAEGPAAADAEANAAAGD